MAWDTETNMSDWFTEYLNSYWEKQAKAKLPKEGVVRDGKLVNPVDAVWDGKPVDLKPVKSEDLYGAFFAQGVQGQTYTIPELQQLQTVQWGTMDWAQANPFKVEQPKLKMNPHFSEPLPLP